MADINIAERRVPQDGRIAMKVNGRGIDLRVATLPTVYGEKVVMRILDKSSAVLSLEDLGSCPKRCTVSRRHTASRTGRSSSPVRPVRASRPRSTQRSTC
jgi:type IV pilus assembly protein PilB